MCETVAPNMLHLNEKALHHLRMLLIFAAGHIRGSQKQSPSEIVILTDMDSVKWMKKH